MTSRIARPRRPRRQRAVRRHAILQRAARQQLHRDHRHAGDLFAAEDVDRVWMTDRRGELPFAEKARAIVERSQTGCAGPSAPAAGRSQGVRPRTPRPCRHGRAAAQCGKDPRLRPAGVDLHRRRLSARTRSSVCRRRSAFRCPPSGGMRHRDLQPHPGGVGGRNSDTFRQHASVHPWVKQTETRSIVTGQAP